VGAGETAHGENHEANALMHVMHVTEDMEVHLFECPVSRCTYGSLDMHPRSM